MIDKFITVNGKRVRLLPYSEARLERLVTIQNEIDAFIEANPDVTFDSIDRNKLAKWWSQKAEVLWEFEKPVPESFFADKAFESGLLMESEKFFLNARIYL